MGLRAKLFALAGLLQLAGALPHHARAADLTPASFNIRIYSTASRTEAELEQIADRLQQFDLIAVQEVRDQAVVARTLAILQARGHSFQAIVSDAVGCGVKERYAFLWRPAKVQALDPGAFFPDPDDAFIREPFIGSFRASASGNRFEALEPIRQGIRQHFGGCEHQVATGLAVPSASSACSRKTCCG